MNSLARHLREKSDWILIYGVYFFVTALVYYIPVWFFGSDDISILHKLPSALFIPLFWFTLKKIYATYDETLYTEYSGNTPASLGETLSFLIRRRELYYDLAGLALCYFLLPFSFCYRSCTDLFMMEKGGFYAKAVFFPPLFAMYYLLSVAAQMTAILRWKRDEKIGQSIWKIHTTKSFYRERDQKVATSATFYLLTGSVTAIFITLALQVTLLFWKELVKPPVFIPLLSAILLYVAFLWTRALISRIRFYNKFRKICRESGYTLKSARRPISSLFLKSKRENFILEKDGALYSCKLLAGVRRRVPMWFFQTGYAKYFNIYYFKAGGELVSPARTVKFGYDTVGEKILIVNPCPMHLYEMDGRYRRSLDNGMKVGDYQIFTGSAFLNAMERNAFTK